MYFESLSTTPHFFDLLIYENYIDHIKKAELELVERLSDKQCFEAIKFLKKMEKTGGK